MPPSLHEIRAFVIPIVASRLKGVPTCDREDVSQETWTACWQSLSRVEVEDWRAYCTTIASRKAADYLRSKKHDRALLEAVGGESRVFAGRPPLDLGPSLERAIHFILSFFRAHRSECADIAVLRYFDALSWDAIAERFHKKTEALRQQWHRCRVFLIKRAGDELARILETEAVE
jgi:RNA polymerase sigma factor (sigma-70 family)